VLLALVQTAANIIGTENFMKSRIPERNWRLAFGRVPYAWSREHSIIAHRLGPQGQQTQDAGRAAVVDADYHYVPHVPQSPATAAARVGPTRRQRAAENNWENEGGSTQPPALAPGYDKHEE
jgi:hypothetical protein